MAAQRQFPRRTLEQALRVPQALKEHNAGNPWKSEEVAKALNLGPGTGNFFYVTAASRHHGLSEGTRDTAVITLTELGRRAVYPSSPQEEGEARLQAFLNVDLYKRVLDYYGGNNLTERKFLANTLQTTFGLPEDQHDEFVELFQKNCKYLGIGASYEVSGPLGAGGRRHVRDSSTTPGSLSTADGPPESDTVTVAEPEGGSDAPVCFVIMPFTERSDDHPVGFFDEALEQLFTPAATEAGFRLRRRRERAVI